MTARIWLLSLIILFSIPPSFYGCVAPHCMDIPPLYGYTSFPVQPPADGHLGCSYLLALVNRAATHTHKHVCPFRSLFLRPHRQREANLKPSRFPGSRPNVYPWTGLDLDAAKRYKEGGRQPGPGCFRGDFSSESEPENCRRVGSFPDVQTSLISYK